ncbi:MAG TPA: 2-dehydropantoate 2-reductase [Candidatus Eisenbacteria bacterium]
MIIGILGAGAVGGYYGAMWHRAGHNVRLLARGAHGAAIARSGLSVKSSFGEVTIPPSQLVTDIARETPVDVLVVCVKLRDTESACRSVAPWVGPRTIVMSLQNGVDKDDMLDNVFGPERVAGAVTYIVATIEEPGVVGHKGNIARIVAGVRTSGTAPGLSLALDSMRVPGVEVVAAEDVRQETWRKFIFLSTLSGMTAVTGRPIGELRDDPETRQRLGDMVAEGANVAAAEGIEFDQEFVEDSMEFIDKLPADGRSSMAVDLSRGQPLELPWLSGAMARRAERLGVPAPTHRRIAEVLAPYADGGGDRYRPAADLWS